MAKSKRSTISRNIELDVLIRSRRRCCLCFFWNMDSSQKSGQLAHVDHDPSNSTEDNLAYLCFEHHNIYDSKQLQGKNFTTEEIRYARRLLYDAMRALASPNVAVTLEIDRDFDTFSDEDECEILDLIRNAIRRGSDVHILNKERGSVRLTVELNADDAISLIEAVRDGELLSANVINADIDYIIEPRLSSNNFISLEEVAQFDFYSDAIDRDDQACLIHLAISSYGLSIEEVSQNSLFATVLGAAEQLRLTSQYIGLAEPLIDRLQALSNELTLECKPSERGREFWRERIAETVAEHRRLAAESAFRLVEYWPKMSDLIRHIEGALSELLGTSIAELADDSDAESVVADSRQHVDRTIYLIADALNVLLDIHADNKIRFERVRQEADAGSRSRSWET